MGVARRAHLLFSFHRRHGFFLFNFVYRIVLLSQSALKQRVLLLNIMLWFSSK